ncbi:hypothetical protein Tco_0071069 [Tanacetum coccineum]
MKADDLITILTGEGSYEHYKSVGAEIEYLEPGFELQGAKMVEMGHLLSTYWSKFEIKEVKEAHESDVRHLEGLVDEVLKLWSDSLRRQETMGGAPAHTRSKRVLEIPNEPPLPRGHTSRSGEGSMEHAFELTDNVPNTPYDSPLSRGYTPGSDEGRMELI